MSDYRNKEGKVFSEEQLKQFAKNAEYSFEEYLIAGRFELIDEKGKQTGVTKKAATGAPISFAADTDLLSDDTSSDSPKPDPLSKFYVAPEDLKDVEETVVPNLQKN